MIRIDHRYPQILLSEEHSHMYIFYQPDIEYRLGRSCNLKQEIRRDTLKTQIDWFFFFFPGYNKKLRV